MTTFNDSLREIVTERGFNTGSLDTDIYNYYKAYTDAAGTRQELERQWLISFGIAPSVSLNNMWIAFFTLIGIPAGSFNDRQLAWAQLPLPAPP